MLLNTKQRFCWGALQKSQAQPEPTDLHCCSLKFSGKFITEKAGTSNVMYLKWSSLWCTKRPLEVPEVKKKGCGGAMEAKQGEAGAYSN